LPPRHGPSSLIPRTRSSPTPSATRQEFAEFGWEPDDVPDPVDPDTFASAVPRWEEQDEGEHAATLAFYRRLLQLLATHPDLGAGSYPDAQAVAGDDGSVVLRRGRVLIVAHLRPGAVEHPVGHGWSVLAATPTASLGGSRTGFPGEGSLVLESSPSSPSSRWPRTPRTLLK